MPDVIKLLPDAIANQIAAGEVVQRPASVVKELLENSVDAGGNRIKLIVKEAGKSLIQVFDDGKGMTETDARMSFERHATSKIRNTEDLFKIKTMGFRGEALASIAAVAQVEMKTRQPERDLGVTIQIEGAEIKKQEAAANPSGTCISVKNLFYNVPARRNFLKSNPVELKHILEEFHRVSLANPGIAFEMYQNDIETYRLESGKLSQRIVGIFGKNYQQQLIPCEEDTPHLNIRGYVGKPEFSKKTRGEQYFFINNRFVKNNYLNHAVTSAFEGLIAADQYPFYVLFIEIDPVHVDINVHPTKTEVKFDDERTIYGLVKSAVKQALGAHNVMPSLDFNADVNFEAIARSSLQLDRDALPTHKDRDYSSLKTVDRRSDSNLNHWENLFDSAKKELSNEEILKQEVPEGADNTVVFSSAVNNIGAEDASALERFEPWQLHLRYILRQVKSGLMIMDQTMVHERILYEKFSQQLLNKSGSSQQSLFPCQLELNPADFSLVMDLQDEIRSLGFVFDTFGKNTIAIQGVPSELHGSNEKELFEGLLEQYKWNKKELALDTNESVARAMARRSALEPGQRLENQEMNSLIDQLFACKQPNYSPDGKPTFVILELDKIASFFNR